MPNDVKAIVSIVALVVAIGFAYWEQANGKPHLFWFVILLAVFAVVSMWIFPEAAIKKGDVKKVRE
jgi:membrane protein YdbS with pleckstrin-like domain